MGKRRLIPLSMSWVVVAVFIAVSLTECAQVKPQQVVPPVYNPYPPGILPADLESEIARVRREVQGIFDQALKEWRALPPPTLKGNPPTLQGSGYRPYKYSAS
jgi:cytochrome c peroxidase